jgi:hypothetical protein
MTPIKPLWKFYIITVQGTKIDIATRRFFRPERSKIWKELQSSLHKYQSINYERI